MKKYYSSVKDMNFMWTKILHKRSKNPVIVEVAMITRSHVALTANTTGDVVIKQE